MYLIRAWLLLGLAASASAQPAPTGSQATTPTSGPMRLRVYLDCQGCFQDYLREEIEWVDFVRQPQDADVVLLSNSQQTGGGGQELVLRFVGGGRHQNVNYELRAISQTAEPENLRRANVLRTVEVGLLNYVARDGLPPDLAVNVRPAQGRQVDAAATRDPWNLWVFRVSTGASIEAEESNRESRWDLDVSADRVTEDWKVSFGTSLDRRRERFDLDEDDPLEVRRHESRLEWFVARSLGPHWSLGLDGQVESSTFGNTKFQAQTAPAVEFSIFPYREYATRRFVIQYDAGVEHAKYSEITLFDKLEETRGRHELSARFDQSQPWGSAEAGVEWSQYFHDRSKYRLEVNGEVSVRLLRGLSISFDGSASRIRDQISLPRRDATAEEVLLEIRELQSGYDVSFSARVSYSFGSIFNNVVNPRFGGN